MPSPTSTTLFRFRYHSAMQVLEWSLTNNKNRFIIAASHAKIETVLQGFPKDKNSSFLKFSHSIDRKVIFIISKPRYSVLVFSGCHLFCSSIYYYVSVDTVKLFRSLFCGERLPSICHIKELQNIFKKFLSTQKVNVNGTRSYWEPLQQEENKTFPLEHHVC